MTKVRKERREARLSSRREHEKERRASEKRLSAEERAARLRVSIEVDVLHSLPTSRRSEESY